MDMSGNKLTCLVCNTCSQGHFFGLSQTLLSGGKSLNDKLSRVLASDLDDWSSHSEVICTECFHLLGRIDYVESLLQEMSSDVIGRFLLTCGQSGLHYRLKKSKSAAQDCEGGLLDCCTAQNLSTGSAGCSTLAVGDAGAAAGEQLVGPVSSGGAGMMDCFTSSFNSSPPWSVSAPSVSTSAANQMYILPDYLCLPEAHRATTTSLLSTLPSEPFCLDYSANPPGPINLTAEMLSACSSPAPEPPVPTPPAASSPIAAAASATGPAADPLVLTYPQLVGGGLTETCRPAAVVSAAALSLAASLPQLACQTSSSMSADHTALPAVRSLIAGTEPIHSSIGQAFASGSPMLSLTQPLVMTSAGTSLVSAPPSAAVGVAAGQQNLPASSVCARGQSCSLDCVLEPVWPGLEPGQRLRLGLRCVGSAGEGGAVTLRCFYCRQRHGDVGSLRDHVRVQHQPLVLWDRTLVEGRQCRYLMGVRLEGVDSEETAGRPFVCVFCDGIYKTERSLKSHFRELHTPNLQHSCPDCGEPCRRRIDVARHRLYRCRLRKPPTPSATKSPAAKPRRRAGNSTASSASSSDPAVCVDGTRDQQGTLEEPSGFAAASSTAPLQTAAAASMTAACSGPLLDYSSLSSGDQSLPIDLASTSCDELYRLDYSTSRLLG